MEKMTTRKNMDVAATKAVEQTAAQDAASASTELKRKPVTTVRIEDISCSIWARDHVVQGQNRVFYSCSLERSYRGRDGLWHFTKSFDPESLGNVVAVVQQAAEKLAGLMQNDSAAK